MTHSFPFTYSQTRQPEYNGYIRKSQYVKMLDGVRLAIDYFIPTLDGKIPEVPLPAIFQMTPYNRAQIIDGQLFHILTPYQVDGKERSRELYELCVRGYVLVVADVRGQGASFGTYDGCMSVEEGEDGAQLVEWIAAQGWCDGNIGMMGSSYGGATQFLTAAQQPQNLRALYVAHIYFDAFDVFFPGGVKELSLPKSWGQLIDNLSGRTAPSQVAPVDGPDGDQLLAQAIAEHKTSPGSKPVFDYIYEYPYRDGNHYYQKLPCSGSVNLCQLLPRIKETNLPIYLHGGWNDYFPGHLAQWFTNWTHAPAKLLIGPWTHAFSLFSSERDEEDRQVRCNEALKWFDYWLKGIENNVLSEPPVYYALQSSHPFTECESVTDEWSWRSSNKWPIENTTQMPFYLTNLPSDSINSQVAGTLNNAPQSSLTSFTWQVDERISSGPHNRKGSSFLLVPQKYPDMQENDERGLTWTSEKLTQELNIAGIPEVNIFVKASCQNLYFFAWLEDIDPQGHSTVISYGTLNSAHRELAQAPYDTAGALYHTSTKESVEKASALNLEVARLRFNLLPVANKFKLGHRIRLMVSCSDNENFEFIGENEELSVYMGGVRSSRIVLPVLS